MGVTGEPAVRAPALRRGCGVRRTPQRVPAADAAAAAAAGAAAGRPAVTARNGAAAAEAQAARLAGCRAPAPHSGPPHPLPGFRAEGMEESVAHQRYATLYRLRLRLLGLAVR